MKKFAWVIGILIVLLAAGLLAYRARASSRSNGTADLQTAPIQRGTIAASLSAAGTVRSNQSGVVAWQTSGKVGAVNVKPGDKVQANQELAALDPNALPPAIISARQTLIDAQKTLANLKNSSLSTAQAEQALVQDQQAVDKAQAKLNAYLNDQVLGTQAAVDQAKADTMLQQNTVDQAQQHYNHLSHLPNTSLKRAQGLSKLSAAQQKLQQDQTNLTALTSPASPQDIATAKADLAVAQAQLKDAQAQWDQVKNGPSAEDITAAQAAVDAAQATLNQAKLASPFSGTITEVDVKPGDTVTSGTQAFRIDDLSTILVDLQVAEVDINNIQVGQPVTLTFDAIPGQDYSGKVTEIGMVGTSDQGVVNYPVTVQITNPDGSVKPGMTAAVSITTAQDNNVLIVPNQAIRVSGGQRTVTILFEGQQISVPVTVGLTNETESEVSSSQLKEGDAVVINNSATGSTSGNASGGGGSFRFFGGGGVGR